MTIKKYASEDGVHKVKGVFALTIVIDTISGKAFMIGNQGSTKVMMLNSGEGYTFIEITGSGSVMTTTIDAHLKFCHSRNTIIGDKLVPTQYYGSVTVK